MKLRLSLRNIAITAALLVGILAACLMATRTVQAQDSEPASLSTVRIDIWPEYDQPSALVIYTLTVSGQTSLPATMTVRIPASAGRPHAVAMQDVAGLYTLNYQVVAAGEWVEVKFTTPVPEVRIEYYDPLQKNGTERKYTFRWPGDYDVEDLALKVQQPVNASGMTFEPALGSGTAGEDGLMYYTLEAGAINAGTKFDLSLSYNKPDELLTNPAQFQPVQPNQPVSSTTPGQPSLGLFLPWIVGGAGLLLIAVGLLWYWSTGRGPSPARAARGSAHRRHAPREQSPTGAAAGSPPTTNQGEAIFCTQCGRRAAAGDQFCRSCGMKLRG